MDWACEATRFLCELAAQLGFLELQSSKVVPFAAALANFCLSNSLCKIGDLDQFDSKVKSANASTEGEMKGKVLQ